MMWRRLLLAAALALAPSLASAQFAIIGPTQPTADNGDRLATTAWVRNFLATGIPLANGNIFIGSAGGIATAQAMSGDCTLVATGVITCTQAAGNFQVIGNLSVGGSIIDGNGILATNIAAPATPAAGTTRIYVDLTQKVLTFKNDAGTVGNAVVPSTCAANQFGTSVSAAGVFACTQPAVSNISGFGTGVATALGINVGSAGAPVLFNGAGGTPSSLTLTNGTGLPIAGITGLGTGVGTALAVNVGTAGAIVVNGGALGTPSSGVGTNLTALNASNLSSGTVAAARGGAGTVNGTLRGDGAGNVTQSATSGLSDVTAPTSWTPTDASGAGLTFTSVSANYTKIGNMVFAYAILTYPVTANGSNAVIGGFPVAFPAAQYSRQCTLTGSTEATLATLFPISGGGTTVALQNNALSGLSNATLSGDTVVFMCIYPAS